jgi:hypothetical protein
VCPNAGTALRHVAGSEGSSSGAALYSVKQIPVLVEPLSAIARPVCVFSQK